MAESTLGHTYWNGLDEISDFLGWGRKHTDEDNLARVRDAIEAGYRQFLFPVVPVPVHVWSFLQPLASITMRLNKESGTTASASAVGVAFTDTSAKFLAYGVVAGDHITISAGTATAGTYEVSNVVSETVLVLTSSAGTGTATYTVDEPATVYPLPDDFGGLVGDVVCDDDPVTQRGEGYMRLLLSREDASGQPRNYATRPRQFVRETGQRWEMVVGPAPDSAYAIEYRYNVVPGKWGYVRTSGAGTVVTAAKTLTRAGETFELDGCVAGDKVILSAVAADQTPGIYVIASVDSETQITLTTAPGADGTCTYEVMPATLYPLGGTVHADTLMTCCKAAAEAEQDDNTGLWNARMKERLQVSLQQDCLSIPRNIGYNSDPGMGRLGARHRGQYVEYDGVIPGDYAP